ncbi:G2-specific protein kinase [Pseudohyphozyma bogoriensis]|nr:G2-specific protein kinase [Pseudohyphozyma bogoriensis]
MSGIPPPPNAATAARRRATLIGSHPVVSAASMEDSYEACDVIGTGSFGIIRKVRRRHDGIYLARKELNYGRMDERDLRQLTEEVNILEQLGSNDNIVRYYERFVDKPNNMLYILMEYCEGGDLAGVIQRCRRSGTYLSEELVWSYLAQITLALSDCHTETDSKGERKPVILHRDIKPENVFLDKENNLRLGDFGLSKAMAQAAMTQTYVGTPYYMSPELINGQPYDVKSDIWALGCLIYELCAGHPPFHEARTQPELAVMIREGKIPDLPKAYTPHLGQVVKAMLKQNPKHRPNTNQIKALDSVKLQIRVLELRKATKELRTRDQQMQAREADLIAREGTLVLREQACLLREANVRTDEANLKARYDALLEKERQINAAHAQYAQAHAFAMAKEQLLHQHHQQQQQQHQHGRESTGDSDVENTRPRGSNYGGDDLLARVASRPSLVPRRPLEERRSSTNAPVVQLPFPRLPSSSSLMSLDDTPIKERAINMGRRLTSKSMHDLASRYTSQESSPAGPSDAGFPPHPNRSPTRQSFGRRSDSAASARSGHSSHSGHSTPVEVSAPFDLPAMPSPVSFRPTPPSPPKAASRPSIDSSRSAPLLSRYDPDDLPSPFIKKMDASRFPGAPPLPTAAGVAGTGKVVPPARPPPARAARAQAGVDEIGRRLSSAGVHVRGKSMV